ncbi:MAG TPA: DUF2357 domain-containing protein, partial [Rhodothermales bacterium]|nr:DUF2357 domain-containing protein [Rhodothermales bacterium]
MHPIRFTLDTGAVVVTWRSEAAHPEGGRLRVRVQGADGITVQTDVAEGAPAIPEESAHRLRVEHREGLPVEVRHHDPVVLRDLETVTPGLVVGPVRFGSTAGWSRFEVRVGGLSHLTFIVEVVPSKLDYRRDLRALVEAVGRISDDLVFALVAPATAEARSGAEAAEGHVAPAGLLDHLGGALEEAVRFALATPLRTDVRSLRALPAHRARRVSPGLLRRLERAEQEGARLPLPALDPALEGPEHRYLAASLRAAAEDARRLAIAQPRTPRGRAARSRMIALAARLEALLALDPLASVPVTAAPPAHVPLRGTLAPGYREAFRLLALVRQRLKLGAGRLPGRLRSLHLLYETWAFLTVAEALASATGARLDPRRLLRGQGAALRLQLGPVRLSFRAPGAVRLVLERAPLLRAPLMPHALRPDLRLVRTVGESAPEWIVLDAKYRLDRAPGYVTRLGAPGPPAAALGALHRYRDALVDDDGERRTTLAVALYPWRDDGRWAGSVLGTEARGSSASSVSSRDARAIMRLRAAR